VLGLACGNASKYESTQLQLVSEGLDVTQLSTFVSSSPGVAEVVGSRVIGRGPGEATISVGGDSGVSLTIVVDNATVQPTLVARIVTQLGSSGRGQSFVSEQSAGYLYVHVLGADNRTAPLGSSHLAVEVLAADKLTYEVVAGSRARVGIAQNALRSGCYEPLFRVSLDTCSERVGAVEPPLSLHDLPTPMAVLFELSDVNLAAATSFARSGALSVRPSEYGKVLVASVVMSDGSRLSLLQDARLSLNSSDPSCLAVIADLSSARMAGSSEFRAVGNCASATITAT
jgi:hypothetical protein